VKEVEMVTVNVKEVLMQSELQVVVNIRGARAVRLRLAVLRVLVWFMSLVWPGLVYIAFEIGEPTCRGPLSDHRLM
jgi:hypothetical protein